MARRRLEGLERVLGVNALFSTAYGNVGSSIYYALGLVASFALGLWLEGRLFPLEISDPLVFLGAIANRGIGAPYFLARMMDAGAGTVTAVAYEYGNTFLIVSGLLNMLVTIDALGTEDEVTARLIRAIDHRRGLRR